MVDSIEISVVVPVYNSEKIAPDLIQRTYQTLNNASICFEIIMVDDFSTDRSAEIIENISQKNHYLTLYRNSKNLGQIYTSLYGISKAKGKYIVTIDDDLEYNPEDILLLYSSITQNNFDVVFGLANEKYQKQGKSVSLSRIRNKILNFVLSKPITDSFKIFKREIAFNNNELKISEPFEMYIAGQKNQIKIGYVEVGFNKRHSGKSNYTFTKKVKMLFDFLSSKVKIS